VRLVLACLVALLVATPAHGRELVLRLQPGADQTDAERIAASLGGTLIDAIPQLRAYLVTGATADRRLLAGHPQIASIEANLADHLTASPPYRGSDWHLQAIRAPEAWAQTRGDPTVTIAALDTGVDLERLELKSNLVAGTDVANDDEDPGDRNGHGTFVAGVLVSNGFVTGACPACTLMPIKVVAEGASEALKFDSADGIVWSVDHGADIVNLSFGGAERSGVQEDAVRYALGRGVVVVAAAGNESSDTPEFPAGYDGVIAVGATDDRDGVWSGSSYGSWVDVGAPGEGVFSLALEGGFERRSGTSFSAPIVSGVTGLLLAHRPGLSPEAVATLLRAGTVPLAESARRYERGRIDAALVLAKASARGEPTLTVTRFALSPRAPFVSRYPEARADEVFAAGAVVVRDDTEAAVTDGDVACEARIGGRVLTPVSRRLRGGVVVCAWRIPGWAGERWVEGSVSVIREAHVATQSFRVKAKKPASQRSRRAAAAPKAPGREGPSSPAGLDTSRPQP
jgi:thermitase